MTVFDPLKLAKVNMSKFPHCAYASLSAQSIKMSTVLRYHNDQPISKCPWHANKSFADEMSSTSSHRTLFPAKLALF